MKKGFEEEYKSKKWEKSLLRNIVAGASAKKQFELVNSNQRFSN